MTARKKINRASKIRNSHLNFYSLQKLMFCQKNYSDVFIKNRQNDFVWSKTSARWWGYQWSRKLVIAYLSSTLRRNSNKLIHATIIIRNSNYRQNNKNKIISKGMFYWFVALFRDCFGFSRVSSDITKKVCRMTSQSIVQLGMVL